MILPTEPEQAFEPLLTTFESTFFRCISNIFQDPINPTEG